MRILGESQLGQGLVRDSAETYQRLGKMGTVGASFAAAGLGDLAVYEGRFSDAVRLLQEGTAADVAASNRDRAAMKLTALAYAHLARNQRAPAAAAAEQALLYSKAVPVRS